MFGSILDFVNIIQDPQNCGIVKQGSDGIYKAFSSYSQGLRGLPASGWVFRCA